MSKKSKSQGMSIRTMTILVGVVMACFLWGVAAAMYDNANGGLWIAGPVNGERLRRPSPLGMLIASVIAYVSNTVMYLPHLPWVVGFILTERTWFAIVALLVEGAVIGFGFWMARLQKTLDSGQAFKTKRRSRPIAMPRDIDDDD
ncbi:MAG: hypothetical protein H7062_19605 [Candidatus Saccharimonas sp.]|nr:hypothetical protein [Planctomycetaceae bacterium]